MDDIIKEFLEATPAWLEALKRMTDLNGKDGCMMCGANYEKIKQLCEALKRLPPYIIN